MNLDQIKSRLQGLQNPKSGGGGELKKTLWAPSVGKHSVRIIPSAFDKSNPFKELYFHYEIGNKTMLSPVSYGEKDPIVEFAQKLRKSSKKEDWSLAKKLEPRMRVFVPVIVRGEEDRGVLLWGFGKQIYMELLSIANDDDVGDYTDPISGRDITIETLDKATTGKDFNTSTVRVRTKVTALSDNADQVKKWLSDQPNPVEQYKHYSYDEMKNALMSYLNPEEQEDEIIKEPTATVVEPEKFSLNTSKPSIDSRIDDLFNV